jgi:S1-C subfamily serine protease
MQDFSGFGAPPRRRGSGSWLTHALVAVVAAGGAVAIVIGFFGPVSGSGQPGIGALPGSGAVPAPPAAAAPLAGGQQDIVAKVSPGLVLINTALQYNSEEAAGTGMVLNAGGLVLTNNHVIEGATKITATVPATGQAYQARVVGYDASGDIALIQLQNASGLATVPIGNSAAAKAGDAVVAMGNAGGQGRITATAGHVTALNTTVTASDEAASTHTETLHGMIQTNADIAPGDSGGPLAASAGVIGMDTAGNAAGDMQGPAAGFAIPIDTALSVARQIAAGHSSSVITIGYPPFIGVFIGSGSSSDPQAQAQQQGQQNGGGFGGAGNIPACYDSNTDLMLPSSIAPASAGTLIDGTICGSPAAAAGLTGGAVITAVNGQAVGSPADFAAVMGRFHPGDTISVTWVSPSGRQATSSLHLTAGPPQ